MPSPLEQEHRVGAFRTPLGPDELALERFDGVEGLSEIFEFRIDALSEKASIPFDQLLGVGCSVSLKTYDNAKRFYHGLLVEARATGKGQDFYTYHIVLRPWLWLLSRVTDCKIFHNESVIGIIEKIFGKHGFASGKYRNSTTKSYPQLEYCVQYRESDLAFVCRLMEQNGIYYYFEHSEHDHIMVLADAKSSHKETPDLGKMRYLPVESGDQVREQSMQRWTSERRFRSGKFELRDFNYNRPDDDMTGQSQKSGAYQHSKLEQYDFPGKHRNRGEGEAYAKVRNEAEQAQDNRRRGSGDAPSLFAGGLTTLRGHDDSSENQQYLVVHATHYYGPQSYRSGGGMDTERPYEGQFEYLPADMPFRPLEITPKPLIHGPQTAVVVKDPHGGDEEIEVDNVGRILVRFFWDRKSDLSCRVRVGQIWSGSSWGSQVIPRVGMEVIVAFIEGDPDRPMVVGTVYNGVSKYPYNMGSEKTISGWKSRSSKGGGGYNEFVFDDKKDSEKIRMHAQKDHEVKILNAETTEIGEKFEGGTSPSRTTTLLKGTDKVDINSGHQKITISNDQTLDINGKQTITVQGEISITSFQKITLTCGASTIELSPSGIKITSGTIALTAPKIDLN